ncbi:30S ribosome-binding factor RbfA [Buchnera aphidicola]|uniref:Ribosome-binding factor A n=1 Tax=Buchnera aphidicola (Stegophylla sp.) TaxID=2315800 RepID=A0A4D6YJ00_9GAMM|nr:30S ribosome-binding factor RbfA [Buchnera aphidicola (Stegophylla sp.)]QCI26401.1 30S ribosome-binding factor RbfA [Buchnera aphidicola (Stegophylla sp.)]
MKSFQKFNRKNIKRSIRVSNILKQEISLILKKYIKDPRINFFITISMVRISHDLSCAKIFFSYLGANQHFMKNTHNINHIPKIMQILQHSSSYIRKILSRNLHLRIIPSLIFCYDDSLISGIKISNLINRVLK